MKIGTLQNIPELYIKSSDVCLPDKNLISLLEQMRKVLTTHKGLGIAAPQLGVNLRVVLIDTTSVGGSINYEMINPIILSQSGSCEFNEGCLSFPGEYRLTKRSSNITVSFHDVSGKPIQLTFTGIDSICVQHEVDHLDGVLFFSRQK